MTCRSEWHTPAAAISTRTSPRFGPARSDVGELDGGGGVSEDDGFHGDPWLGDESVECYEVQYASRHCENVGLDSRASTFRTLRGWRTTCVRSGTIWPRSCLRAASTPRRPVEGASPPGRFRDGRLRRPRHPGRRDTGAHSPKRCRWQTRRAALGECVLVVAGGEADDVLRSTLRRAAITTLFVPLVPADVVAPPPGRADRHGSGRRGPPGHHRHQGADAGCPARRGGRRRRRTRAPDRRVGRPARRSRSDDHDRGRGRSARARRGGGRVQSSRPRAPSRPAGASRRSGRGHQCPPGDQRAGVDQPQPRPGVAGGRTAGRAAAHPRPPDDRAAGARGHALDPAAWRSRSRGPVAPVGSSRRFAHRVRRRVPVPRARPRAHGHSLARRTRCRPRTFGITGPGARVHR